MSLEHAILSFLRERPRTGYDLKTRCFDGDLKPFWSADQAQIYRTLDRLRTARHVTVTTRRQAGRPDRHLYEITRSGRELLDEWLATACPAPPHRDAFFVQLYFGASLPDDDLLGVLEARKAEHERRLDELARAAADAALVNTSPRTEVLRQTAFDGAAERERALINWLEDCIRAVREGALPGSERGGVGQRHLFEAEPA